MMNSDQNGSVSKLLGSHKSNLCHFYIRLTSTLILYDIPSLRLSGATRSCWSTRNLKERVGPLNHQVQRKRNLALDESKYQTYDEYLCMAVDNCYIMFTHLDIIYYGIVCGFRPQEIHGVHWYYGYHALCSIWLWSARARWLPSATCLAKLVGLDCVSGIWPQICQIYTSTIPPLKKILSCVFTIFMI